MWNAQRLGVRKKAHLRLWVGKGIADQLREPRENWHKKKEKKEKKKKK